ncbi:hypothetical protein BHE74_00016275 [Ensete ventricosum]|nr:hypothetical protein GW17_00029101 [Ensete ventricosum]RWW75689.1 hypothetical protein BHE74_00016275 [Ensete ventricosum]RZS07237.1 hypothetical protein BHM03_00038033 [Ensete ventricosum]
MEVRTSASHRWWSVRLFSSVTYVVEVSHGTWGTTGRSRTAGARGALRSWAGMVARTKVMCTGERGDVVVVVVRCRELAAGDAATPCDSLGAPTPTKSDACEPAAHWID